MNSKEQRIDPTLYIPNGEDADLSISKTTHLGIVAHHDDLEFMALSGILECYGKNNQWFGGIICTDGRGSVKAGAFANFTDEELMQVRIEEQNEAARLGAYSFVQHLGFPSSWIKDKEKRKFAVKELESILQKVRPEILYLHNPFDKHPTHLAVLACCLDALKNLPPEMLPQKIIGCEGWRGLDWLPEDLQLALPVNDPDGLGRKLNSVYRSQIESGKAYDKAVDGRRFANATFSNPHAHDQCDQIELGIDLKPLVVAGGPSLEEFAKEILGKFTQRVLSDLGV